MVLFSSTVSSLIFSLLDLSVTDRGILKSPTVILYSFIFLWNSVSFSLMYFNVLLLGANTVSLVAQSCLTLCDPMKCSTPGFPVDHQLLELAQTHVHWVSDAIQPSHPLSSPSPPAFNLSQHQGLFQWVSSLHQVAKILELELQHQSFQWIFQWIFRTDFL